MTKKQQQKAREIIHATASGRGAEGRRIAALRAQGFTVTFHEYMWNFGQAGTCKVQKNGSLLAQLECAKGKTSRKNGYTANLCPVYRVEYISHNKKNHVL